MALPSCHSQTLLLAFILESVLVVVSNGMQPVKLCIKTILHS